MERGVGESIMAVTVLCNGCFDVLHLGHVDLLRRAAQLGRLVVAINSDASVQRLKGSRRPVQPQYVRKAMLEAIRWVDEVLVFESEHHLASIVKQLRPVLVKGEDYVGRAVTGSQWAEQVVFVPLLPGFSTSSLLDRINQTYGIGSHE